MTFACSWLTGIMWEQPAITKALTALLVDKLFHLLSNSNSDNGQYYAEFFILDCLIESELQIDVRNILT